MKFRTAPLGSYGAEFKEFVITVNFSTTTKGQIIIFVVINGCGNIIINKNHFSEIVGQIRPQILS